MRINRIKDNDIANGFGITMSLWTQGCPHHCKGCFNGETWSFTDGEEFGFGAEIGIITKKLQARGPMGLKELTTIKYIIY